MAAAGAAGGSLPENLKTGVKAVLSPPDFKKFAEVVRGLKARTIPPAAANALVKTILPAHPQLAADFAAWSAVLTGAAGGAPPAAAPPNPGAAPGFAALGNSASAPSFGAASAPASALSMGGFALGKSSGSSPALGTAPSFGAANVPGAGALGGFALGNSGSAPAFGNAPALGSAPSFGGAGSLGGFALGNTGSAPALGSAPSLDRVSLPTSLSASSVESLRGSAPGNASDSAPLFPIAFTSGNGPLAGVEPHAGGALPGVFGGSQLGGMPSSIGGSKTGGMPGAPHNTPAGFGGGLPPTEAGGEVSLGQNLEFQPLASQEEFEALDAVQAEMGEAAEALIRESKVI
ncbi:hypothetical protein T484DRAFT_1830435 [Baffinella frigidus]|nr:hypothetical protein T484DRAFT_1830435 [Cryptophyta sp. CCMP2293]